MNTDILKKILFSLVLAVLLSACEYDDSALNDRIDGLEERIENLEKLCSGINEDIDALQQLIDALQSGDYVTSVEPIIENGEETGFLITFQSGKTVVVSHGRDGADGADGADGENGYTPRIGVEQGTDGRYYWTVDGQWLLDETGDKIPAQGEDGQDGADGQDGTDGQNGADGQDGIDGADGKDGITPELKIGEDGNWYVSVDGGQSWELIGPATGTPGADGADGGSLFTDVEVMEDGLHITLSNGTELILPMYDEDDQPVIWSLRLLDNRESETYYRSGKDTDENIFIDAKVTPRSAAAQLKSVYQSVFQLKLFREDQIADKGFDYISPISGEFNENTGFIRLEFDIHQIPESYFDIQDIPTLDNYSIGGYLSYHPADQDICAGPVSFEFRRINPRIYYWSEKQMDAQTEALLGDGLVYSAYYPDAEKGILSFSADFNTLPGGIKSDDIYKIDVYSIDSLAAGAFCGFSGLQRVNFRESGMKWGTGVFEGCTNLEGVRLYQVHDASILPERTFKGCTSLQEIPTWIPYIGKECFYGCTSLNLSNSYYDRLSCDYIGESAFAGCTAIEYLYILGSENSTDEIFIGKGAFEGCTALNTFYTTALKPFEICENAFANCPNISRIDRDIHITRIEKNAFDYEHISASDIDLLVNAVTEEICEEAFAGVSLKRYSGVNAKKVGRRAFYNCTGAQQMSIKSNVKEIGDEAFDGMRLLSVDVFAPEPPVLGTGVFVIHPNLMIWIHEAPVEDYKNAPGWSVYKEYIW